MENLVLKSLITNDFYYSKCMSYLKTSHFQKEENSYIFKIIKELQSKYANKPTPKEIGLYLKEKLEKENSREYAEQIFNHFKALLQDKEEVSQDFLNEETEKFVKQAEMKQCILDGAMLIKESKTLEKVYERLGEALQFSLDTKLGVELQDQNLRTEYYRTKQQGIPFGLRSMDEALGGGIYPKTLNIVCAVTHGGKSLLLSHFAVNNMLRGLNGVYFTLEMPELMLWKRLDANALGIPITELQNYDIEKEYASRLGNVNLGKLFVKEYGAGVFNTLMLENYVKKVQSQNNIKLDYICIDYLTLMCSYEEKRNVGSYTYFKKVAEELHRYAKESGIPILTAAQLNRSAFGNEKADMDTVGDSIGIAQTADTMFSIARTPELDEVGQVTLKFMKNRNTGNLDEYRLGINLRTLSFYDLES